MYTCYDCGATFEYPREYIETHGLDTPPYEKYEGCPYCGGSFADAIRCDGCGEYITDEYVQIGDQNYCDGCFELRRL